MYWFKTIFVFLTLPILYILGLFILPIVLLFCEKRLPVLFIFWDDYENTLWGDVYWRKVLNKNSYKTYGSKLYWLLFKNPLSNYLYFVSINETVFDLTYKERSFFGEKIVIKTFLAENVDGKYPMIIIKFFNILIEFGYNNKMINTIPYKKVIPLIFSVAKI